MKIRRSARARGRNYGIGALTTASTGTEEVSITETASPHPPPQRVERLRKSRASPHGLTWFDSHDVESMAESMDDEDKPEEAVAVLPPLPLEQTPPPPPELEAEMLRAFETLSVNAPTPTRALRNAALHSPAPSPLHGSPRVTPRATPSKLSFSQNSRPASAPGSGVASPTPGSTSTKSSPITCSICLSPIRKGKGSRPNALRFRTSCCGQLFHKECMKRHKEHCASPNHPRGCPLCRSSDPTGLTPCRPPTSGGDGGFISGLALHTEMNRRVSAARNAVARSLAARSAASANSSPASTGGIFFTSPGAAYNAVRSLQYQARMQSVADDENDTSAFAGLG